MRLNVKYLNNEERTVKKETFPDKFDIVAKVYINRCNFYLIQGYKSSAKRYFDRAVKAANDFGCTLETESNIDWMYKDFYFVNDGPGMKCDEYGCFLEEKILSQHEEF